MPDPLSTMLLLQSENKYPDCLWMKLEGIPVQLETTEKEQLDLYLTLQFNEHWEPLLGGRVKFGLKGGELRLALENAEISLAVRELTGMFRQATTKSGTENLVWLFEIETSDPVLKDSFQKVKLGTLEITDKPCRVEAMFSVSKQNVYLTDAEGLWRHNINPNQHAVLERMLVSFLWETKLKPCLSWAQFCYECSNPCLSQVEKPSQGNGVARQQQIQDVIQQISEAKTHDFLELVKIAGLDPMVDLAGGNLRGTTIEGADLSGANLCHTNLRGADLCDVDLSEANLSRAKLSGADLSGAYLENADLSHADFYRASLALANLIEANLSGACLIQTNLSSANLSAANVKGARFGHNPGLSEEMKLNLMERGAIFEEY